MGSCFMNSGHDVSMSQKVSMRSGRSARVNELEVHGVILTERTTDARGLQSRSATRRAAICRTSQVVANGGA